MYLQKIPTKPQNNMPTTIELVATGTRTGWAVNEDVDITTKDQVTSQLNPTVSPGHDLDDECRRVSLIQRKDDQTNVHLFDAESLDDSIGITKARASHDLNGGITRSQSDGNKFKPNKVLGKHQNGASTSSYDIHPRSSKAGLNEKDKKEIDRNNHGLKNEFIPSQKDRNFLKSKNIYFSGSGDIFQKRGASLTEEYNKEMYIDRLLTGDELPLKQQEDDQTNVHPFDADSPDDSNGITNRCCDMHPRSTASISEEDNIEIDTNITVLPNSTRPMCKNPMVFDERNCTYAPYNPFEETFIPNKSLFFRDGCRSVDYVLAWQIDSNESVESKNQTKRDLYRMYLEEEGLETETVNLENFKFLEIHAPLEILRKYAEILKLRMPMKQCFCELDLGSSSVVGEMPEETPPTTKTSFWKRVWASFMQKLGVDVRYFPREALSFTAVYSRDKEYLFEMKGYCLFTAAKRSLIVKFILDRKPLTVVLNEDRQMGSLKFALAAYPSHDIPELILALHKRRMVERNSAEENLRDMNRSVWIDGAVVQAQIEKYKSGRIDIESLISDEVYLAAYPLHDGEIHVPGSMRHRLYTEWASFKKWYRHQPLYYIKEYFGVQIGFYFAWLQYYTKMLTVASLVSFIYLIYAFLSMYQYVPSNDICSNEMDIKMCPLCDNWCDIWELKETCLYSRLTYLLDNPGTIVYAVFMSVWAAVFLQLWKRYSAGIKHQWDLTGLDVHDQHARNQFFARLSDVEKFRYSRVMNTRELEPPYWTKKLPGKVFSFSVVVLLVLLAMVSVLAVLLYRLSIFTAYGFTFKVKILTTVSAAFINLIFGLVFSHLYKKVAEYFTEFELLRTQTEFDDSVALKIYLLEFVNYYSSIFYIAFFKGNFVGRPGDYNLLFDYRQEECAFGGCLLELCIQLAIIMSGKQILKKIVEKLKAKFCKYVFISRIVCSSGTKEPFKDKYKRYVRDLKLVEWSIVPEYIKMTIQYGFVTIFACAFPLAPVLALINNIISIRLDASTLLRFHRRPVAQRVPNIGVWYGILDGVRILSVLTNACLIAFTSEFIPRSIYKYMGNGTLEGYVDFRLSLYQIPDLTSSAHNVTQCRYPDYREPPGSVNEYETTIMYWYIMATRLMFVVFFQNIVYLLALVVSWCMPEMSAELGDNKRREAYITTKSILKEEKRRFHAERAASEQPPQSEDLPTPQPDLVMHGPNDPSTASHSGP